MLARLAPVLFVLLRSSAFIASKHGLRYMTPLLFVAVRLVACAAVLVLLMLRERLHPAQWLGLTLGMAGVGLVVGHAALESPTRLHGLALAFAGVLGLVGGTLYFGRFCRGVPLLAGATAPAGWSWPAAPRSSRAPRPIPTRRRSNQEQRCRWMAR